METAIFGNTGEKLSRIGLGCFSMSGAYGTADDAESIATIHRAIDLGVTLLDTSASYGQGHNHRLIGKALKGGKREKVFIHSKTGTIRTNDGSSVAQGSGAPDRLRRICETSLDNLGIETLDALCMSRVDPTVPIEESVGAMARLVEEGKTRFIALSEAAPGTLRRAVKVHPLVSLQYEYSLGPGRQRVSHTRLQAAHPPGREPQGHGHRAHGRRPRRAGCRVPAGRGCRRPLSARRHDAGQSVGARPHPDPLPEGDGAEQGVSPGRFVKKYPEPRRGRFLSDACLGSS